jgi:hypothetical protein
LPVKVGSVRAFLGRFIVITGVDGTRYAVREQAVTVIQL